jgi:hypothetical protein
LTTPYKKFSIVISLITAFVIPTKPLWAQQDPSPMLVEARQNLPLAFKNEAASIDLYNKLQAVKNPDPLLKGYVGASSVARSRHAPLLEKKDFLKKGTTILEEAIKEKPNTLELIFLRLTIQVNLPSFLGYNDNIDEDKAFVIRNYDTAPPQLRERIVRFVQKNEEFTAEEKSRVK